MCSPENVTMRWMIIGSILFTIPVSVEAQTDFKPGSFRYFNRDDGYSVILENELRPLPGYEDSTYSITVIVRNVRNSSGVIRFKFYDDTTPFPHDTGFLRIVVPKSQVINNTFMGTYYGFTSGYIGIALHDDENSNKKLDFSWFLPREGYAFSDYFHSTFMRPDFSKFRFLLRADRVVVMTMRYH